MPENVEYLEKIQQKSVSFQCMTKFTTKKKKETKKECLWFLKETLLNSLKNRFSNPYVSRKIYYACIEKALV